MIKYFTRLESCNPSICRNNGKCRLGVPPTCLCQAPYSGEFCQISKSNFFNTVHHGKDATYLFPRYFLIERHFHSWLHIFYWFSWMSDLEHPGNGSLELEPMESGPWWTVLHFFLYFLTQENCVFTSNWLNRVTRTNSFRDGAFSPKTKSFRK